MLHSTLSLRLVKKLVFLKDGMPVPSLLREKLAFEYFTILFQFPIIIQILGCIAHTMRSSIVGSL